MKKYISTYKNIVLNKIMALIVVFALVFSTLGSNLLFRVSAVSDWSGNATAPSVGDGSELEPYIIATAEELAYVVEKGGEGKYYKLTSDIYLNSADKVNWNNGQAIGDYSIKEWYTDTNSDPFYGYIDGNGHIIYGLYVNNSSDICAALFPELLANNNTSIKNLGIDNAYIKTTGKTSALIANANWNNTVDISNCYIGTSVVLNGAYSASFYAYGGSNFTIKNCYSRATVSGTNYYGVVADTWGGIRSIENSYIVNSPITTRYANSVNCTNVYSTDVGGGLNGIYYVSAANMQGDDALTNSSKMAGLAATDAFKATSGYPILKIFDDGNSNDEPEVDIWDGTEKAPLEGDGSESNPYLITNAEELAWAVKGDHWLGSYNNTYYKLTNDIYLNDISKINWKTGGITAGYSVNSWYSAEGGSRQISNMLHGTFDGNGHVIYGLYYNDTSTSSVGLFPKIQHDFSNGQVAFNATIKNLGIENVYISNNGNASAIVGNGNSNNTTIISNCYVGSTVTLKAKNAGSAYAAGGGEIKIDMFYSLANVSGTNYGLIGDNWNGVRVAKNSYVINSPITSKSANGIDCTNVYSTDTTGGNGAFLVSLDNMKGQDVLTNNDKMPSLSDCDAFIPTSSYPVLKLFYKDEVPSEVNYWDGTELEPKNGLGTEEKPFLIAEPEELAFVIKNGGNGKYYKLTSDLYLNDKDKINWVNGTVEKSYNSNIWYNDKNSAPFNGVIDGDGYVVYGLYSINTPTETFIGLFPKTANGAVIKNLGIDKVYISALSYTAALVGFCDGETSIEKCYVGKEVSLSGKDVGTFIGGGGGNYEINSAYSLGKVSSYTGNSGMIGDSWGGSRIIKNSFVVGLAITTKSVNGATCSNVYATDITGGNGAFSIADSNMQGLDALSHADKMPALSICNNFYPTNTYPILKIFMDVEPKPDDPKPPSDSWDGTIMQPTEGEGNEDNPYLISKPEELAYIVKTGGGGKYYKLTKDIYINKVDNVNWKTGQAIANNSISLWYTSNDSEPFYGYIDGDGHVIYGLYNSLSADVSAAFLPELALNDNTEISNLGIDNAYMKTGGKSSAFIADGSLNSNSVKISNCYVGESVVVNGGYSASFYAYGGSNFSIENCYSLATVSGTEYYGMIGDSWGGKRNIENSYIVGSPITSKIANSVNCINVYSTDNSGGSGAQQLELKNMQGLDVLTNSKKMVSLEECDAFVATEIYPILKVFSDVVSEDDEDVVEGKIWSGKVAKKFVYGDGTKNNPYIITNGAELAYAVKGKGFNGSYFKLTNDIYLNDVTDIKWSKNINNNKWVTSSEFYGHIDGNGYIVYGIWYPEETPVKNGGLISVFNSGTIKNIGVRYSQVRATVNAGAIVGITEAGGTKTISNCFSDETVTVKYTSTEYGGASGIVGQAGYNIADDYVLAISNCYTKAYIYGNDVTRVNGIIGTAWQCSYTLKNCYSKGISPYNAQNEYVCSWLYSLKTPLSEIYQNIYTDARKPNSLETFTYIAKTEDMIGEKARVSMSGLDFENIFQIVNTSTPKLKIFASITGEDVDLSGDTEVYSSGKGTQKDPFIISNSRQLKYLLQSENTKGKYYELSADIYLNDVTKSNWKLNNPNVWYNSSNSKTFSGYIDGKGYKIYGLFLNETPNAYSEKNGFNGEGAGLFPNVDTCAVIRNIHVRHSYISGEGTVGALIGKINGEDNELYTEVIGCSADETVTVKGQTVGGLVGGGTSRGLKLYCSYFTGKVSATAPERENALVGDIWGFDWEMIECYFVGYPAHRYSIKPSVTAANYGDIAMTSAKYLTLAQMTGSIAKEYMTDFEWDTVWKTIEGDTPQLNVIPAGKVIKIYDSGEKGEVWSGYRAESYASGSGTKKDPYIIETVEQMARLVDLDTETAGKYYKLVADLKINDTSKANWKETAREWYSGENKFAGHFDGNGHVVFGLYYNTSYANAGLFQVITSGAVIEKVGISNASITNLGDKNKNAYSASLVAMVAGWDVEDFVNPRISQCFADHTVEIKSYFTGGLIGGCGMFVDMDNCYFTGTLTSDNYIGQAIGNLWNNNDATNISYSYFLSTEGSSLCQNLAASAIVLNGVYHKGYRGDVNGAVSIGSMLIRGEAAKEQMPKLDYVKIWKTVDGGTPVLRCFANAEKYSVTELPDKVEISFASQGGSSCESIYGYPLYSKLTVDMLPTPTRYGYKFAGWYHFSECFVPVEDGIFPNFNTVFYAKWESVGFVADFEEDLDSKYDYNSNVEHYEPGIAGYSPLYVENGLRAMHLKKTENGKSVFLLSYDNTLAVGEEYDIVFNICTDETNISNKNIRLIHANHPQFDSDAVGYEEFELTSLTTGKWQEQKVNIVANSPYLLIEADSDMSLYFDNIKVVPLGKQGKVGDLLKYGIEQVSSNSVLKYSLIIGLPILTLAAVTLTFVLIMKKHKK